MVEAVSSLLTIKYWDKPANDINKKMLIGTQVILSKRI